MKSELTKEKLFEVFYTAGMLQSLIDDKPFNIASYHLHVGKWMGLVPVVRALAREALYRMDMPEAKAPIKPREEEPIRRPRGYGEHLDQVLQDRHQALAYLQQQPKKKSRKSSCGLCRTASEQRG